jgi:hypothetical protein
VIQRWEIRVFAFLLVIIEVNTYLVCKYFAWLGVLEKMPMLAKFRRKFSWALIHNQWISSNASMVEEEEVTLRNKHGMVMTPPHAKEYCNRWWVCNAASKYQQYACRVNT